MNNKKKYIIIITVLLILVSCDSIFNYQEESKKTWTIMLYVDEDFNTNISRFNLIKNTLKSNELIDIVVLEDQFNYTAKYWYLDEHEPIVIEEKDELNMGSSQTLYDFIKYSKENYPARRYLLAIVNHGGAWLGACWDWSHDNDWLTPKEIEFAIEYNGQLDILMMVACSMGSIEVAHQFSEITDVYISSENSAHWDFFARSWDEFLSIINSNLVKSNKIVGKKLVDAIWNAEGIDISDKEHEFTFSAIDTKYLSNVIQNIDELSVYYLNNFTNFKENLDISIVNLGIFRNNKIDLINLLEELYKHESNLEIRSLILETIKSYNEIVIRNKNGNEVEFASGCSIYLPIPSLESYNTYYSSRDLNLKFVNDTHWDELLETYFLQSNYKILNNIPEFHQYWDKSVQ